MRPPADEQADIQALVHTGWSGLDAACFLLLDIADAAAARAWLADLRISSVADLGQQQDEALQVALGAAGLAALGVSPDVVSAFAPEFVAGLGDVNRARRLGDVGPSAPDTWLWGGDAAPHLLLLLYAPADRIAALCARMTEAVQAAGLRVRHRLQAGSGGGPEPFGFADGISQPVTDWANARDRDGYDYRNLIAPGEVLLGYENEYGQYTERPLLPANADPAGLLPQAADDPVRRDLGRNGTYLVFRHLAQDVAGFWRFLDAVAGGNRAQATALAEAFVGRRMTGTPLLDTGHAAIAGVGPEAGDVAANGFIYDADPEGRCPLGAHVRRANPRNGDLPGGRQNAVARLVRTLGFAGDGPRDDVIASSRFHRVLRRGRPYGTDGGGETGLHFICLNASIARQFEFVQNAWLMSATFDGCDGETDPLLGSREPLAGGRATNACLLQQSNGLRRSIGGLPRFVTVRGGGYFFMPGLRALRFLARG